MIPEGCVTIEREVEDTIDKKTNKPVRKITTVQECKLNRKWINENKINNGIPLTKDYLYKLIEEQIEQWIPGSIPKKETNRQRLTRIFGDAYNELKQLSKGIMETSSDDEYMRVKKSTINILLDKAGVCIQDIIDDDEVVAEKCGDNIPGNRLHKADGTWGSKKTNTSWSLQNKGCGASQMKPGSNVRRATKLPCGRKAREKGKDVPCKGKSKN